MSTFADIFGPQIAADDPIHIENGELKPAQWAWIKNAVDVSTNNLSNNTVTSDEYIGGEATKVVSIESSHEFTISLDYEITEPVFAIRYDARGNYSNHYEFDMLINGQQYARIPAGALLEDLEWFAEGNTNFGSIGPGDVDVDLDMDPDRDGDSGGEFVIDAIGIGDDRFVSYDDNTLHEPGGHVDGPPEYPDSVQAVSNEFTDVEGGITEAGIDVVINDTTGSQALALSFDGGDTWTSASNTTTIDATAADAAPGVTGRITIGSTDAVRNTASPRTGYEPQIVSKYELSITEIDQVVFDQQQYRGSYYEIAQKIHEDGGLIFNAIPHETALLVESFQRGDVDGDPVEWTRQESERVSNTKSYANVLTIAGGRPEETDNNPDPDIPVVTVKDQDEIDRIGEEIPDYDTNESLTTQSQLENYGKVQLRERTRADNVSGTVEIVPQLLEPGKVYYVPAWSAESVLERQTFQDGKSPTCRLEFEEIVDISTAVSGLRGELSR